MDYKDLDVVLKVLNHNKPIYEDVLEISQRLPKENNYLIITKAEFGDSLNPKTLLLILNKLNQDRLIERHPYEGSEAFDKYNINYNGVEFIAQGGYEERFKIDDLIEKKLNRQQRLLSIAAFGTAILGAYYFLLLLKEFVVPFLHQVLFH